MEFVALVLRQAADRLSDKQPRKRGQAPQVDHGSIAMSYAFMVGREGIGKTKAIDALAEQFEVSVTTVKTALRKYGAEAVRIIGGPFI